MAYQKIINFLDNTPKQLSKLRTENWIKVNDQSRGVCNVNSDIRFKNIMLKSGLCDYSDAYILVKVGITITGAGADAVARKANERDKEVIIKSCAPFINNIIICGNILEILLLIKEMITQLVFY